LFELGGDSEEEFFFVGAGDQLDVDGEAFRGLSHRKRKAGEAGEIEPLAETHRVAVIVGIAGTVVTSAVFERGGCGDR
jgi:hypothetical protein